MSEQITKVLSKGAYGDAQVTSSYPEAYSGDSITLDNRLYLDYLKNNNLPTDTYPLNDSVHQDKYAPAGGVVEDDLLTMYSANRPCHPAMTERQNQDNYILDDKSSTEPLCQVGVSAQRKNYENLAGASAVSDDEMFARNWNMYILVLLFLMLVFVLYLKRNNRI